STVINKPLITQIATVSIVAIIATIGVYGIVALIVRMDDFGMLLINKSNKKGIFSTIGSLLIQLLPKVIRALSVIGTIALILVSGGIFLHSLLYMPEILESLPMLLQELIAGIFYGTLTVIAIQGSVAFWRFLKPKLEDPIS